MMDAPASLSMNLKHFSITRECDKYDILTMGCFCVEICKEPRYVYAYILYGRFEKYRLFSKKYWKHQ